MKLLSTLRRRKRLLLLLLLCFTLGPSVWCRLTAPWNEISLHALSSSPTPRAPENSSQLSLVCFNIAHGRGQALSNLDGGSAAEREARLRSIGAQLCELDADVVVLNEVDFQASWSNGVNQAEFLAKEAGYGYWLEQRNFDARFLGWTWRFGNALLSKVPIESYETINLVGDSWWESVLAGKKKGINCTLALGGRSVRVLGVHLSYRSEAVRVRSARQLLAITESSQELVFVAGDLNSSPFEFSYAAVDDAGNNALTILGESEPLQRRVYPSKSEAFTYEARGKRRMLDWILVPANCRFSSYEIIESQLSDHRPVYARVELP